MRHRVYLSNIAPHWSLGRQEKLFAERVPGWPKVPTYCDTLSPRKRKAHNVASLADRANLLRPTSRKDGAETIYVASPPCLAWSADDFAAALTAIAARGATLVSLDPELMIPPDAGAKTLHEAIKVFQASKRVATGAGPLVGAMASAGKRKARADAAVHKIASRWPLPSQHCPTAELLKEAGVSLNTVISRLGRRPLAQARHQAAARRKERRQQT